MIFRIDLLRYCSSGLEKLMDDDNFILTTKFRSWVEGLIQKALNSFDKEDNKSAVVVIEEKGVSTKFHVSKFLCNNNHRTNPITLSLD